MTAPANETDDAAFASLVEQRRYQVLKNLLLDTEKQRIRQLESYFQNPSLHAEKIAESLPDALRQSDGKELHDALDGTVQESIIKSIENDPALYADALYPVIFPAIKKSIAESFKEMMQSVNHAIEQGLSLNRFVWHYESWRSGVPYREVVLRHTLTYQVEQAFLIHRETGLLLRHVSVAGIDELRDSDAVSAMLTAIQDFIKDSFSVGSDDHLDTVEIGDYTVFLNRGSHAVLACVIQGIAPYSLRERFESILQNIHQQFSGLLKDFDGDNAPLEAIEPDLQQCLLSERRQKKQNGHFSRKYLLLLLPVVIFAGYHLHAAWQFRQRVDDYLRHLHENASILLTQNQVDDGILHIQGLYDPLTPHPDRIIGQTALSPDEVESHWQAYQSLSPAFVKQRLKAFLRPPASVTLTLQHNRLIVAGLASKAWIDELALIEPALFGLESIESENLQSHRQHLEKVLQPPDTVRLILEEHKLVIEGQASVTWRQNAINKLSGLDFVSGHDLERLETSEEKHWQALAERLEQQQIYFESNSNFSENQLQKLEKLVSLLKKMQQFSLRLGKNMRLEITGHTDGTGTAAKNTAIAKKRAQAIMEHLKRQKISVSMSTSFRLGQPGQENRLLRKVSFKAIFYKDERK